jgi:hypothetical protein
MQLMPTEMEACVVLRADCLRSFRPHACRALVVAAVLLMLPVRSTAAPLCAGNTLAGYIGAGPCSIDGLTFSNFGLVTPLPTGATPIALNQITVTPFNTPSGIGFSFGFDVSADPFDLHEILFGYQVSGAFLTGASLGLSGASATDDGVVTGVQDVCVGGVFNPGSLLGCSGTPQSNIVFAIDGDQLLNASLLFANASLLGIVNDIAIDGGTFGSAALQGSVTNTFAAVPEPTTAVLVASGIAVILRQRRRR